MEELKINNTPPPLNYTQFMQGYGILKYALGDKRAAVAIFLGRRALTLRHWEDGSTTPDEWWWRPLFIMLTYTVLDELQARRRSVRGYRLDALNSRIQAIRERLKSLEDTDYRMPIRIADETEEARARRFLLRTMKRPNHWYKFSFISQHAKDEGINVRTLRRAAVILGVDKQRKDGFQSPSYWSRPREELEQIRTMEDIPDFDSSGLDHDYISSDD